MKNKALAILRGPYTGKSAVVTIFFCGLLGWVPHLANTLAQSKGATVPGPASLTTEYPVGTSPNAVIFDGTNIWVANRAAIA